MFGTFRDKLAEDGTSYRGGSEEKVDNALLTRSLISNLNQVDKRSASAHDAKASLLTPPDPGFAIYMVLNLCVWIGLWFAVTRQHGLDNLSPHHMAFLVSVGPLILAQVIFNPFNPLINHDK